MKKKLMYLLCAALAVLCLTACTPVAVADESPLRPVSVQEYTWGSLDYLRIEKVYELALTDTERRIPQEDFEQNGYLYHLVEMTKENKVGVDTKEFTKSVTKDCKSGDTEDALKVLDAEIPVTTEDGYEGKLLLDHTSVRVSVKGYNTSSKNVTATRVYSNLADADLSLIPKSITENGNSLTLNDAQWESGTDEDGNLTFTATAEYSGTSTSRYATGYTVSANYVGNVVKTNCDMIVYTVIFQGERIPKPPAVPETETEPEETVSAESDGTASDGASEMADTPDAAEQPNTLNYHDWLAVAGCVGGIGAALAAVICAVRKKRKGEEKQNT